MMKKVNTTAKVIFSSEIEDQNLLKNVKQELIQQKYDSFSVLCKKALRAFLSASSSVNNYNNQLEQTLNKVHLELIEIRQVLKVNDGQESENQLAEVSQRIEKIDSKTEVGIGQLRQQMNELKQMLSNSNELQENQFNDWFQTIEKTNARLNLQMQQMQDDISQITQILFEREKTQLPPVRQSVELLDAKSEKEETKKLKLNESPKSQIPTPQSEELLDHFSDLLRDDF